MNRRAARPREEQDRGAAIVMVALLMVVLLGIGALVIDAGAMYVEKRMLQNGADAAAMALIQECGLNHCQTSGDVTTLAQSLASSNASGRAVTVSVCGGGIFLPKSIPACAGFTPSAEALRGSAWIRVVTSGNVAFQMVPGSRTISASSVAAWGAMNEATTLPLVLSQCAWEAAGGNLDTGAVPSGATTTFQSADVINSCTLRSGKKKGIPVPGDFGWLSTPSDTCLIDVTVGGSYMGDKENEIKNDFPKPAKPPPPKPGPKPPKPPKPPPACSQSSFQGQDIIVPIYSTVTQLPKIRGGNPDCPFKTSGPDAYKKHVEECFIYDIAGLAQFHITSYKLSGNNDVVWPTGFSCGVVKKDGKLDPAAMCVSGSFTQVVSGDTWGSGEDFGVRVVKFVG